MSPTNLTLQREVETIRSARIVAAKRGALVSAAVTRELENLVLDDERYEDARRRAAELMRTAAELIRTAEELAGPGVATTCATASR